MHPQRVLAFPFVPNLLHRTAAPRPLEIAGWVNRGRDMIAMELGLASSAEYYARH